MVADGNPMESPQDGCCVNKCNHNATCHILNSLQFVQQLVGYTKQDATDISVDQSRYDDGTNQEFDGMIELTQSLLLQEN